MPFEAAARAALERELGSALTRGEFELHYQPIVELATERLKGVEALLRWRHPDRGLLAPADFLQIAEDSGQLLAIGRWVLHEACREAATWPASRRRPAAVGELAREMGICTCIRTTLGFLRRASSTAPSSLSVWPTTSMPP